MTVEIVASKGGEDRSISPAESPTTLEYEGAVHTDPRHAYLRHRS